MQRIRRSQSASRRTVRKNVQVLASCAASVLLTNAAFATSDNWTGASGTDTNWTTAGNWFAGNIPGTGDTATFNDATVNGNESVYTNAAKTIGVMSFTNTGTTTILG